MSRSMWQALCLLALVALGAGCGSQECSNTSDCADKGANYVCANTRCVLPLVTDGGVTCDPACSGATPICDTNTLTCVACVGNSDCGGATPACDANSHTCVACAANSDCTDPSKPSCDTTTHTCFACGQNSDCSGSTPVCDTDTHACVTCMGNSDCSGSTPACNTVTHTCVACNDDSSCGGATPACNTSTHTCVACNSDSQCGGATPACDTVAHTCVACTSDTQCSASNQVCDTSVHACVGCLGDGDCSDTPSTPACNTTTKTCVTCTGSNSSACGGSTPFCNAAQHACVGCLGDNSCTDQSKPRCDAPTQTCVQCENSSDCASTPGTPLCDPGTHTCAAAISCTDDTPCAGTSTPTCDVGLGHCVQCTTGNTAACTGGTPVCDGANDVCVQCDATNSSACTGGTTVCDTTQNKCVQCQDNSKCSAIEDCDLGTEACKPADVNTASGGILATRTAPSKTAITVPINGAIVTYLKPGIGSGQDGHAGFFVQAEQTGPAVFVGVNPTTLSPAPVVGDRVTFTVTGTVDAGVIEVTSLDPASYGIWDGGVHPIDALVQNLNSATSFDPDTYESEIVNVTGSLDGGFAAAGSSYQSVPFTTPALDPTADVKARFVSSVITDLNLSQGCVITLQNTPMWRFKTEAQPSGWRDSDVSVVSCPAPKPINALASTATTVTLTFDRELNPASVLADGSQFTLDNGATVTAAVSDGAYGVTLTTSSQTSGTTYTATVANTVKDTLGTGVAAAANSVTFTGYVPSAQLRITEINANITASSNGGDMIEFVAVQGGSLANMKVYDRANNGPLVNFPAVTVATNEVILVHIGLSGSCSETTSKNECPQVAATPTALYNDSVWDFTGPTGLSYTALRSVTVLDPAGNIQDGALFYKAGTTSSTSDFVGAANQLQQSGLWSPATPLCTDFASCSAIAADWSGGTGVASNGSTSIKRSDLAQPSDKSKWGASGASSWGTYP